MHSFLLQPAVLFSKVLIPFLFFSLCSSQASEPIYQALSSLKLSHLSSSSSSLISQAHQAPIFLIGLSFIIKLSSPLNTKAVAVAVASPSPRRRRR